MVTITGNATTGYTPPITTLDLPRPADGARPAHQPWCADCKRKHAATDLDSDGRCARCATIAVRRAQAAQERTAREAEAAAAAKAAAATRTTIGEKQGKPTPPTSAPRTRRARNTTGRAPVAGPSTTENTPVEAPIDTRAAELDAQVDHAAALLRRTATATHPLVRITRASAIAALEALHLTHELHQATAPAAPATGRTAGDAPNSAAPAQAARSTRPPAAPRTGTDPRKIHLPADDVIAAYRAGQTLGQIATTHGVSAPTVRRCLLEHDEPRRRTPVEHTPELLAEVRRLYDVDHLTQIEIAERIGLSSKSVANIMTAAGVNRRAAQARHASDNAIGLKARMAELSVTTKQLRAWARSTGRDVPDRGLVSRAVVEAYATAHPHHPSTTNPAGARTA